MTDKKKSGKRTGGVDLDVSSGSVVHITGDIVGRDKKITGDEVHGDKVSGDKFGGDKVSGDKNTVGNVSGGTVAQGRGAQATSTSGVSGDELAALFINIYESIANRAEDPDVDKEEIQETVQKIEQEAAKGEDANPKKVERWLTSVARMAPDILDVVTATLINPAAGVAEVIHKLAKKAKAEAS